MKTTLFIAFFALISSLQISQKGLNLIKEFEGCKLEAYRSGRNMDNWIWNN